MKKFILGFLTAALLFTAIPIGAAIEEYICYKADYKVVVNGEEYINEDLPILNYKGNTYAPFRSILESAGLDVSWNAELKQAEVTTATESKSTKEVETVNETNNISEVPLNKYGLPDFTVYKGEKPAIEDDGKNQYFTFEGVKYIRLGWDRNHPPMLEWPYHMNNLNKDSEGNPIISLHTIVQSEDGEKGITLIEEIPYSLYKPNEYYIQYDYYINTFLPAMK